MQTAAESWIGADPGGQKNFGIAILGPDSTARSWCVDCADDAVRVLDRHLGVAPAGIRVDAPLWWSSGISGDRLTDQSIRKRYRLSGGQVQASNSLRGAAIVQAAMFIARVRERFPQAPVTETHPKALLAALRVADWTAFSARFKVLCPTAENREHDRDAVVSAIAAREGFSGRWPHDLSLDRHPSEQDPASYWLAPVHYFWPDR